MHAGIEGESPSPPQARDGPNGIYKLDPEGQAELIMPDGIQPAWSPDGQTLAFTTYRDSNLEIYLADHEGRLRNLTLHDGRTPVLPGRRTEPASRSKAGVSEIRRSA